MTHLLFDEENESNENKSPDSPVPNSDSPKKPAVEYIREGGVLKPVPRGSKNSKFKRDPKTGILTQD